MDSKLTFLFVLNVLAFESTYGYSTGAPPTACNTMMPQHGFSAQGGRSPHGFVMEKFQIGSGEKVKLTLKAHNPPDQFMGFFIQARNPAGVRIGKFMFETPVDKQLGHIIDCEGGTENAVTHLSPLKKSVVNVTWIAPEDFDKQEKAEFFYTVVESKPKFWVEQKSAPVVYNGASPINSGVMLTLLLCVTFATLF